MGAFSDTPVLIATGTILPYRFVKISAENSGTVSTTTTELVIGVTDGSTKAFNNGNHCESGDPITLQGGDVVLVEASAAIAFGERVGPTTAGKAVKISTTVSQICNYVALESGGAGLILRVMKCNSALSA